MDDAHNQEQYYVHNAWFDWTYEEDERLIILDSDETLHTFFGATEVREDSTQLFQRELKALKQIDSGQFPSGLFLGSETQSYVLMSWDEVTYKVKFADRQVGAAMCVLQIVEAVNSGLASLDDQTGLDSIASTYAGVEVLTTDAGVTVRVRYDESEAEVSGYDSEREFYADYEGFEIKKLP